ncbi:Ribosomal protein L16p/L10e family protein (apicoplast) [Theileria parva strain Muguga]|uniref:Ribosomal protein L16, putative n=1 Tax=Theileria parva TaxID=5875 RepID=Q4MYB7_THEPA|nr:Ribosomal protein L16p/L10e family protein [Theileria parva strain Muguga]|eukprot:XP_762675.1 ribosomal protein L16 (apicoplast) [Theileria parva strain Muguga]
MVNLLLNTHNKKYKSNHMYKLKNIKKNIKLDYGDWGIVTCKSDIITPNQIEACRCCIVRNMRNKGKIWIKVRPTHIISKKPKDSRMGSGKGTMFKLLYILKPGEIIFEGMKTPLDNLVKIFNLINKRLNIKIKLILKKNVL